MSERVDSVSGNIVDVLNGRMYPGTVRFCGGRITEIVREDAEYRTYVMPGFIDSHVHIESSMLVPSEFARAAVAHGTVAAVSDPHEIANVLGVNGVKYMIDDAGNAPLKFYFAAPSCVPASAFETSGAALGSKEVEELLKLDGIKYLGEVMNVPGVINKDPEVLKKIAIAKKYSKQVDGHAPGLRGEDLRRYVAAGITTDHECFTKEEALEKISLGVMVQVREGSAAKNFDELVSIIGDHYENCMLCSDDKHPNDLLDGHINVLVKRAVSCGVDLMKALRVACVNPVRHYGLDVGLLRAGDYADFIVVENLEDFRILRTYVNGKVVAEDGKPRARKKQVKRLNNFKAEPKRDADFRLTHEISSIKVIEAVDGQLVTNKLVLKPKVSEGAVVSDTERDILKIAVVNRYAKAKPALGFVRGFGLKRGAIASSVAHDSHNILAVGVSDKDICRAVNLIIENSGGISAVSSEREDVLPLPVAGIMSDRNYFHVAEAYTRLDDAAKKFGSKLSAPYMTLSFMALLVIPKIKLSDRGLFDGEKFEFTSLFS